MARRWNAVLARLGTPTGDGRILVPGGITSRDLPLPILWQRQTEGGHGGSIVVARMETISFGDDMVTATGSMLDSAEYSEVIELIEAGVIGPSVDLDDVDYVTDDDGNMIITKGRVSGATLVPIPAFEGVSITLDPLPAPTFPGDKPCYPGDPDPQCEDVYHAELMTFASTAQAARTATVVRPTADMFRQPDVDRLTPLVVTNPDEQGRRRVFGHIAGWETEHVGLPGRRAPKSRNGYASFMVAPQVLEDGSTIAVGTLVTGPRHADPELAFRAAQQHYDDLNSAVAKVVAGEDAYGIWVAGWIAPGVDPVKLEQFMSTPVSGDWRRIGGSLELIAVCSVNVPGFPTQRVRASFSGQTQRTLIASFGITPRQGGLAELADANRRILKERRKAGVETWAQAQARWRWAMTTEGE